MAVLNFRGWQLRSVEGPAAAQLDHKSRQIAVTGDIPEGYSWDLLVMAPSGATDVWSMTMEEPLRALAPDAVILATGSVPLVLPIPGLADCGYVTAQDLLLGKTAAGRRALVVGGGMVGCEAAEYLAERGHQVAIVEMKDVIAADVTPENRRYMFRNFEGNHVLLQPGAKAPGNAVLATGDALEAALAI